MTLTRRREVKTVRFDDSPIPWGGETIISVEVEPYYSFDEDGSDAYDEVWQEEYFDATEAAIRYCSICDGMGHGYPGGGPCPLEVNEIAWGEEERERLMYGV